MSSTADPSKTKATCTSSSSSSLSGVELAKKRAAERAVERHVSSGMTLGIGSGSTIVYAVQRIAELFHGDCLRDIVCVPTSFQSQQLLLENKLPLSDLTRHSAIDVCIDGADELDSALNCIKGGGGCHLSEKMVAFNSKVLVVVADYRKRADALGTVWRKGVPIAFLPTARVFLKRTLIERHSAESVSLRMAQSKAGPVITDEGFMIYDVLFKADALAPANVQETDQRLHSIPGVIETGLFLGMCEFAYIGNSDGTVSDLTK